MPKNRKQGIIFGIIMSYAMAYGMEVYNVAIKEGVNLAAGGFSNMTNMIFWDALKEALYMGLFVFLFSNLWGNCLGAAFAARHCDPQKDNPYLCRLLRQAGTVAVMCPAMSLVASILFNVDSGRSTCQPAAFYLGGNLFKESPHGVFLEHVCRSTFFPLAVWKTVPSLIFLQIKHRIHPAA